MEKVAGQQSFGLGAEERTPGGVPLPWSRTVPPDAKDPPHGRLADPVPEPDQFAVHSPISPTGVLPRQPTHQVLDVSADPTAARPIRVPPRAFYQPTVPGQQRARCHQPVGSQRCRQHPGQSSQDRPVGPVRLRAGDLSPQHRHLMTEHYKLRVLGRLATRQQHQPAEDPDRDQIQETKRHNPRSCPNPTVHPKPQVSTTATSSEAVQGSQVTRPGMTQAPCRSHDPGGVVTGPGWRRWTAHRDKATFCDEVIVSP